MKNLAMSRVRGFRLNRSRRHLYSTVEVQGGDGCSDRIHDAENSHQAQADTESQEPSPMLREFARNLDRQPIHFVFPRECRAKLTRHLLRVVVPKFGNASLLAPANFSFRLIGLFLQCLDLRFALLLV